MEINQITSKVKDLNDQVKYLQGSREVLTRDLNKLKGKSDLLELDIQILDEVIVFFSKAVDRRLSEVEHTISDIINKGLRYIFKTDTIGMKIETVVKNNRTQFKLTLTDGKIESNKLDESFGGGLLSIVSFLFQTVVNILVKNERLLVFDETLNFVSRSYQPALSQFIKQLCEEMHLTLVLITHQPTVMESADRLYEAYAANDGSTKFRETSTS